MIDRLSLRERPVDTPVMHQRWCKLLFLHWRVDAASLRALLPSALELDTYEGEAWIGVTPFTITGIRPPFLPAVPFVSETHELNVRTYVHHQGVPGVWFYSLDASNPLAVTAARLTFRLPYYHASMNLEEEGATVHFSSRRSEGSEPMPSFRASWRREELLTPPPPESLEFFLIERYSLYASHGDKLYRSRIHHRPWPLRGARIDSLESSMLTSQGLPNSAEPPLVHAQAEPLNVEIWPLKQVGTT
jgi:uncharacterized protein